MIGSFCFTAEKSETSNLWKSIRDLVFRRGMTFFLILPTSKINMEEERNSQYMKMNVVGYALVEKEQCIVA